MKRVLALLLIFVPVCPPPAPAADVLVRELKLDGPEIAAFDGNSVNFAAAGPAGGITVFNFSDEVPVSTLTAAGAGPLFLGFSGAGDTVYSAYKEGGINSCNIYSRVCAPVFASPKPGIFAAFLPASDEFLFQAAGGALDFIGKDSGKKVKSLPLSGAVTAYAPSSDKMNFWAGLDNGGLARFSVFARGMITRTSTGVKAPIILIKPFEYSRVPPNRDGMVKDRQGVPRHKGVLALDAEGDFHLFSVEKAGKKRTLRLLKTVKGALPAGFAPVEGLGQAGYMAFANAAGELKYYSFKTMRLSYEDKELKKMLKDFPVPEDRSTIGFNITLADIEEKTAERLPAGGLRSVSSSPDGKYLLAASPSGLSLFRDPVVFRRYQKLLQNAESALGAKKYDLAITLYSQALGLYQDKGTEEKRDMVWEEKRAADAERLNRTRNLQKGKQ